MPAAAADGMAEQKDKKARDEEQTDWPHNPPLPPRELDPTGEGDALRSKAHPGDDTVFAANAKEKRGRNEQDEEKRTEERRRREAEDPRPHIDR